MNADNDRMPLRKVLLQNPKWKRQYLQNVRHFAEQMKWEKIGPVIQTHRELISGEVANDTRKLTSTEAFNKATSSDPPDDDSTSLRAFLEKRSKFLLNHDAIKSL